MKQLIMNVLEDMSGGQINLESEAARKTVANTIVAAIKTNKKGWFLDIGSIDGKPKLTKEELEVQRAKETWVCSICGESTYDVDYDYIGSGTNHLGCELKSQEEIEDFIEDIDEQAYAQGRGSSYDEPVRTEDGEYVEDGIRREKNLSQKKHEDKVFNQAVFGDSKDLTEAKIEKRGKDRRKSDRREKKWLQKNDDDLIIGIANEEDLTEARIQASSDHNDGWVKKYYEDRLSEAIVDNKEEKYIYESPDGGKTVYRRKFGEDKRELMDKKEWEKGKKSSIAYNIQPTPINEYGDDDWATPTGSNVIGEIK